MKMWNGEPVTYFVGTVESNPNVDNLKAFIEGSGVFAVHQDDPDKTGFTVTPERYAPRAGRTLEAIDEIRMFLRDLAEGAPTLSSQELGEALFIGFCMGTSAKYHMRVDHSTEIGDMPKRLEDMQKREWYEQMAIYAMGYCDDPRTAREGWVSPWDDHGKARQTEDPNEPDLSNFPPE